MTLDVDRLVSVAMQLAGRVRDDDPEANQRWLHASTTAEEREALLYVLAAAVPVDVEASVLYHWTVQEEKLRPHGTLAALGRHRKRKERPCDLCRAVENTRGRARRNVTPPAHTPDSEVAA